MRLFHTEERLNLKQHQQVAKNNFLAGELKGSVVFLCISPEGFCNWKVFIACSLELDWMGAVTTTMP